MEGPDTREDRHRGEPGGRASETALEGHSRRAMDRLRAKGDSLGRPTRGRGMKGPMETDNWEELI